MRKKRLYRVLRYTALVLAAGCLYGAFVAYTGLAVPCVFYRVTGFKCPGCGVTRMCVALLRLDFSEAFWSNPMLFVLSPVLAVIFATYLAGYVKDGRWSLGRIRTVMLYVCIALLVAFGVVRNLAEL